MKKITMITIGLTVALAIASCTRSAAIPLVQTATPAKGTASANSVKGLNALELAGTQTAVAKGTTNPSMPTLSATGTPGTPVAQSTNFPTPTSMNGTNATATPESASTLAGATATNQSQQVATLAPTNRPAATSAPAVNPGTYIIQFGEFPYCLARRFDVDPDALLAANGLADGQNIQPGTALVIPTGSGGFPGNRSLMAHPSTWIVDPGDTVYSIACAYGDVNPLSIVSANGLTGDYELTVGTVLQIP